MRTTYFSLNTLSLSNSFSKT